MLRTTIVAASFTATSIVASSPAIAGLGPPPILGGQQAQLGQFPSVVVLEVGGGLCTGTLITPEWVLTAAHCISPQVAGGTQAQITSGTRVHFGTVNLRASQGRVVRASETIPDSGFDLDNLGSDDIGLIRLATPVTDVAPVAVNLDAARASIGLDVTMVGFGATAVGGGGSVGVEYVVQQKVVGCQFGLSNSDLLCFSQVSGKGKCQGDSGGPSFATIDGKSVQVGVTSFGDENCSQYGADTRTDAERAFLLEHVPALACQADGVCAESCGRDSLPVDPDCPVCTTDAECADAEVCADGLCVPEPFAPGGEGSECTSGEDCATGTCAIGPDGMRCSTSCTPGAAGACPADFECLGASGGGGACWPADGGGCCDAGGNGGPTALVSAAMLALALGLRRRSRAA